MDFTGLARAALLLGSAASIAIIAGTSACAAPSRQHYDLSSQPLGAELRAIGRISGREIMFRADIVAGRTGRPLQGDLTADEAVDLLLAGSDLVADHKADIILVHRASLDGQTSLAVPFPEQAIVVTGSRIRGAPIASSTITLDRETLRDSGYSTLGDAIRSIPQNFSGGQTPGIAFNTPTSSGENVGGASSINLRGIGEDATLTLIDGRRVAYGGYRQSIDVSAIPLLAVARIEIVPDGASAIYGSDAVAGVANIILRRDYQGLTTSARLGTSTDGGDFQQQYTAITGRRWNGGGFVAAYDFERDTAIDASQRDYAAAINPGLTLYPASKHHTGLINFHQDIGSDLTFSLYTFYNHRIAAQSFSIDGLATSPTYRIADKVTTFAISPDLIYRPGQRWQITLNGTYGRDSVHFGEDQVFEGVHTPLLVSCFCNQARSIEVGADGPLATLPAGDIKVATGGGYRSNRLHSFTTIGGPSDVNVSQAAWFGYGELSLPLLSSAQQSRLGYRLNISGAVRYEDYPGIAKVATPKFGIVYAPDADIDLKASWGRSFKAPTLYQLHNTQFAELDDAAGLGAGLAPNATAISLTGGNTGLKPERAESWSTTFDAHPQRWPGLHAEISYFHIRYRNRILSPLNSYSGVLDDARFGNLVARSPDASQVSNALNNRTFFNFSSGAYDPSTVIAIIDNRDQNVASQKIQGVDTAIDYRLETQSRGTFSATINAAYIHSVQRLTAEQAELALAGTIFNPPHWRGRAGFVWQRNGLSISSYANYTGALRDSRFSPAPHMGARTSFDLTGRYQSPQAHGALRETDILLSVQNLSNVKPRRIRTDLPYQAGYDSTNYAPFGRVISLTLSKGW